MPGVDSVVVHVGSNNIRRASSEHLKFAFKELILALKDSKKQPVISGPVPSLGRGCERFSRLLALHIWLNDYCSSAVTFIDQIMKDKNCTFEFRKGSVEDVNTLLLSINNDNPPGSDNLDGKLLKIMVDDIATPICHIVNLSLLESVCPQA